MTEEILEVDIYLLNGYNKSMIVSFRDKETAKVYQQEFSKKLPQAIQRLALRKLMMIDNASSLNDLRIPPANHLEQLSGQRKDEYAFASTSNTGSASGWTVATVSMMYRLKIIID